MKPSTDHLLMAGALALGTLLSACGSAPTRPAAAPAQPPAAEPAAPQPDKGDPQARFDAALTLWKNHDVGEAEKALVSLVQDFPDHSGPWTNLGILYAKSNRPQKALGALTKAATLNPQNKVAFNWLGILYRETNDMTRAEAAYQRALAIDPNYPLAHYNYAVFLDAFRKQPAAALPHYRAYLQSPAGADDLKVEAWVKQIESTLPLPAAPAGPGAAPAAKTPS